MMISNEALDFNSIVDIKLILKKIVNNLSILDVVRLSLINKNIHSNTKDETLKYKNRVRRIVRNWHCRTLYEVPEIRDEELGNWRDVYKHLDNGDDLRSIPFKILLISQSMGFMKYMLKSSRQPDAIDAKIYMKSWRALNSLEVNDKKLFIMNNDIHCAYVSDKDFKYCLLKEYVKKIYLLQAKFALCGRVKSSFHSNFMKKMAGNF